VRRLSLLEGALDARGRIVVVDVLRAASFACWALGSGALRIFEVPRVEDALALKRRNPEWLLAGERGGVPPEGFDLGNSPSGALERVAPGMTVIHCTSAGTQGLAAASRSSGQVAFGSFPCSEACARWLAGCVEVDIVAMGAEGIEPALEDEAFSDYLTALVAGGSRPDATAFIGEAASSASARAFREGDRPGRPSRDLDLSLELDAFSFVPVVTGSFDGFPVLEAVRPD